MKAGQSSNNSGRATDQLPIEFKKKIGVRKEQRSSLLQYEMKDDCYLPTLKTKSSLQTHEQKQTDINRKAQQNAESLAAALNNQSRTGLPKR